jgi:hypothetical protein
MDVVKAAVNTAIIVRRRLAELGQPDEAIRSPSGTGTAHQLWALEQVTTCQVEGEKAHRWLGYAQGALAEQGLLGLEEAKLANLLA